MKLTQEQEQAASHHQGPALTLAVPGAGKTSMLLERTHRLIGSGVDPRRILTITFSRASARDMKARFEKNFPQLARRTHFSTIHSFAYSILRSYERKTGLEYTLLEGNPKGPSKHQVLKDLYRKTNQDYPKEDLLDSLIRDISYVKNKLLDPQAYSQSKKCQTRNFYPIFSAYEDLKRDRLWIDFDDMILEALRILKKDPHMLASVRQAYDYIQVDEGQDTSYSQMLIIKAVAQPQNNFFIVADDDQSIYGFRGAHVQGLLQLKKDYPDLKVYFLSKNFRSSKNIIDLCQDFIEKNRFRYPKTIKAHFPEASPPLLRQLRTLQKQYDFILKELEREDLGSVAILFRNNISALGLVEALERANIPFKCRDTKTHFLYHWVVRDIFDIFSFAQDPTDIDLFEKFYYKIFGYLSKKNIGAIRQNYRPVSVFTLLKEMDGPPYFKRNVRDLEAIFKKIPGKSLYSAILTIEKDLDYAAYISRHAETFGSSEEVSMRILFYLKYIARDQKDFLGFLGRIKELDRLLRGRQVTDSPLTLSTFHGSKGLEFDTVFLIDLISDIIPAHPYGSTSPEEDRLLLEEERRLFYVAMSRAKKKLYLLSPKTVNGLYTPPSPFYEEVAGYLKA
ncbi:MAG: ATP-dependent helicase [Tissierellia bacterium]|nr:ATP-dependent helicase [Tissierellia bacterium]